jgi:ribosomal protein S18 acetylase RimI-like enzyme
MLVRAATPEDSSAIATIHIESWRAAYKDILPKALLDGLQYEPKRAYWQSTLERGKEQVTVVEHEGQVQGWMLWGEDRDFPGETYRQEVYAIYVAPPYYRKGIGTKLFQHLFSSLNLQQVYCVSVWVLEDNAAAIAFYRHHGFSTTPEASKMIIRGGAELNEIKLWKRLALE